MQGALRSWSKKNFGYVTKEIEALRGELEEHQLDPMVERQEIRRITDRMDELLYREEMMWLQRSRLTWLKEGDRNTKYFHKQAVSRAPKNRIKKLKDSIGIWREDTQELQQMSRDFCQTLFVVDPCVAPNELFTDQEITDALFQMGPLKAPGPDSFPTRFFQKHWDTLRADVVLAVKKFFTDGLMPPGINDTSIVLIPKGNNPEELKDFRPISLCNVIYKVISKCLVNRLRPVLRDIISPAQSAFVPGR